VPPAATLHSRDMAASRSPAAQPSVRSSKLGDLGRRHVESTLGEQVGRFRQGEGEVVVANLGELPLEPQPLQRQLRIRPGEEHQPQHWCWAPQQGGQPLPDRGLGHLVQVVEHDDHRLPEPSEPVGQAKVEVVIGAVWRHQLSQRVVGGGCACGAHCGQDVRPEPGRVIVVTVERHPRDRGRRTAEVDPGCH